MIYEYILFNLIVIAGPWLAVIFYPSPTLLDPMRLIPAIVIPFVFFSVWDHVVTGFFWRFNKRYVLGFSVGKLPVEELLFFIVVPVACLFLYVNLETVFEDYTIANAWLLYAVVLGALTALAFITAQKKKWYTATVSCIGLGIVLLDIVLATLLLSSAVTWYYFGGVIILLSIFNGYLTARPILIYDNRHTLAKRIGTIPIEDYIYGLSLVLLNLIIYNAF